jgi:hypothetical protein
MVILLSLAIVATGFVIVIEKRAIYDQPVPVWVQKVGPAFVKTGVE